VTRSATDKLLRVTSEQIERMYAAVSPDQRNAEGIIDALLARVLRPENAALAVDLIRHFDERDLEEGDLALMRLLDQIADDR
jgi:hypothetical protein